MIDFRYHLVSIVAIFLALAVGLVLGSTVLRPYALKGLERVSKGEQHEISVLLQTRDQLQRQAAADNQFAGANAGQLLHQLLEGQQVALIVAPGAPGSVTSGITQAIGLAGAKVTGTLQLQSTLFDISPTGRERLAQLAEHLAPPGLTLAGSAQAQASELIANSIMTKDNPGQPVAGQPDSTSSAALDGLVQGGFLTIASGQPAVRATLAVVIIPAAPPVSDSNEESQALVTLAQQLDIAGLGTVVAGSITGSGPGSAIDVMRQGGRGGHLSSVDDADYEIGQITVVDALVGRMHGKSGSYGVLATAGQAAPSPGPTPVASPTPTPTPTAVADGTKQGRATAGTP
jgi:hypothetical protein